MKDHRMAHILSDEQSKILTTVGALLMALQLTEKMIAQCAELILQLDGPLTIELLERQKQRKRTLGSVLAAMRRHVEISEPFDAALSEYLEKRNTFVHRLSDAPGWSLDDEAGRVAANRFMGRLWHLNWVVMDVFCGLARAYCNQNPGIAQFPDVVPFGKTYSSVIDHIFSAKDWN
jgi:hypothetical protein